MIERTLSGRWRTLLFWLPVVLALVFVACGSPGGSGSEASDSTNEATTTAVAAAASSTTTTTPATAPTEHQDESEPPADRPDPADALDPLPVMAYNDDFGASIQPIFADRCASCHSPGGPGTAHWVLETVADIAGDHDILAKAVSAQFMPPWPAGGDSPAFKQDRSLRDDQLQAIQDWADAGGAIDVPLETPIEPRLEVVALPDPDMVLAPPSPYTGSTSITDDYRCQIYDPQLPDGGWITDYEFIPDQTEVVHHAIGYMLPAEAMARAEAKDGEDGKPGWQCYGSSGLGADEIFLGWAPGQHPSKFPAGTGLWVEPGGFIVIQIHYHYETSAPADNSVLAVNVEPSDDVDPIAVTQYIAPAEIPCSDDEEGPLCDRDAAMAAAVERYGRDGVQADGFLRLCGFTPEDFATMTDGTASSSCDIPVGFVGGTGEIVSILGHEHEIGSWLKMTLNPGRPDERVLLDIPVWDFDWQYNYEPVERIVLDSDDMIRLECGWDRSLRDPKLEPAYVLWADGTNDEMCFATISTRPT